MCSDKLEAKLILWCTYTKSPWIIEAAKCLNCKMEMEMISLESPVHISPIISSLLILVNLLYQRHRRCLMKTL